MVAESWDYPHQKHGCPWIYGTVGDPSTYLKLPKAAAGQHACVVKKPIVSSLSIPILTALPKPSSGSCALTSPSLSQHWLLLSEQKV